MEIEYIILFLSSVYSRSSSTPSTNRNFWLNFSRNTDNPADIVEAWHHLAADITGLSIYIKLLSLFVWSVCLFVRS